MRGKDKPVPAPPRPQLLQERGNPGLTAFAAAVPTVGAGLGPAVGRTHPSSGPWWEMEGQSLADLGGGRKTHRPAPGLLQSLSCPMEPQAPKCCSCQSPRKPQAVPS